MMYLNNVIKYIYYSSQIKLLKIISQKIKKN